MSDNRAQQTDEVDETDLFQRRLGAIGYRALGESESEPSDVYQAHSHAQEGREEEGLTFYHQDGVITVKFYVHLTDIICTSHQFLTLVYMDCAYTLQGRNLHELIPLLKRHKLDGLHCFTEADHVEPAKGAVIYRITRETYAEMRGQGGSDRGKKSRG